jgi:aminoglycoside 6'-N-acetyltransferase I
LNLSFARFREETLQRTAEDFLALRICCSIHLKDGMKPSLALYAATLFFPSTNTVISTGAAHAFVSCAVEKSASRPLPLSSRESVTSWLSLTKINEPHPRKGEHALTIKVRQAHPSDKDELAKLRELLWPEASIEDHGKELGSILRSRMYGTLPLTILVAQDESGALTGFIEVGLRSHADGCDPARPVGYVEGWFVPEAYRKQGIGSALMRSAEVWARDQDCLEMASDTWIDNEISLRSHQALGFEVVDRCIHFRKPL